MVKVNRHRSVVLLSTLNMCHYPFLIFLLLPLNRYICSERITVTIVPVWTLTICHGNYSLREKCPYSEFFWFVFACIWTEYGEIWSISPYSVRMRENTDQKNSEYERFLRIVFVTVTICGCGAPTQ